MRRLLTLILLICVVQAAWPDPNAIANALVETFFSLLKYGLSLFIALANQLVAYNPVVTEPLSSVHSKLISLLAPLYLLILTWSGVRIMTGGGLESQVNARITIQNSLVSMLIVAFSLPIYKLLINLSQLLSAYFITAPFPEVGYPSVTTLALFLLLLPLLILFVVFLIIRFFFISFGVLLFPIGVFLYFFSPTKPYGRLLLSLVFFFLFIQLILSLIISVMEILATTPPQAAGLSGMEEQTYKMCVFIGALLLLILIPIMVMLQILLITLYPEIKLLGLLGRTGASVKNVGE
ncbi:MAG: hypothetical protein QXF56_03090 [Candidatus Micrarchaeia archaeon]